MTVALIVTGRALEAGILLLAHRRGQGYLPAQEIMRKSVEGKGHSERRAVLLLLLFWGTHFPDLKSDTPFLFQELWEVEVAIQG